MSCPVCTADVIQISMSLLERQVTMHSCPRCDTRWWDEGGDRLALVEVLDLASAAVGR
jgi:Zn-finger nucleic acid-binding protein